MQANNSVHCMAYSVATPLSVATYRDLDFCMGDHDG